MDFPSLTAPRMWIVGMASDGGDAQIVSMTVVKL